MAAVRRAKMRKDKNGNLTANEIIEGLVPYRF
jgi:hypothetical protein